MSTEASASNEKEKTGTAEISWFAPDIIQTRWSGRVNGELMRETLSQMKRELETKTVKYWYCDTTGVTNYSVDIRKSSTELLSYVKSRGCEEIVSVVSSAAIRMLSMSLSFVVALRVKVVATAQEAREYLTAQSKGN